MSNIQLSGERPAEGSRSRKKLNKRSEVWKHFDETPDGQRAICKYCSNSLSAKSTGGTTHLKRHSEKCKKRPRGDRTQQVTVDLRDEVTNIGMTQKETWQEAVAKKAILAEIPFAPSDYKKFWYSTMEPVDVEKEIYAYYEHEKEKLALELNNLTSRVSFSIEIMEGDCVSLTAHFINADFNLVKKLIGFKKLPDPYHTTMINMLEKYLCEWKLEEKNFTFTAKGFNLYVMKSLKEKFSSKMILGGRDISVPCCKEKLEKFCYEVLDKICDVKCIYSTKFFDALQAIPSRIDTFNQIANERGLPPINEGWFQNFAERNHWLNLDSTSVLRILKKMVSYKDVFIEYYALTETGQPLHWQRLQLALNISEQVNCVLNGLSFKHPTSHLYLRNILEIHDMINIESNNNNDWEGKSLCLDSVYDLFHLYLDGACDKQKTFIVAGVLDPRYKLCLLQYWYDTVYEEPKIIEEYRGILNEFFSEYTKEEANNISSSLIGTINTQDEGSSNNNTYLCPPTLTNRFSESIRGKSELDKYLREEVIDIGAEDFDLLGWWKQNQSRFPILSRMARDILAVPACVYSTKGTIQSDLKSLEGVDPQLLEAVICSKDWILAREQRDVSEPKN